MENRELTYVLITPARNEAGFIEGTIKSVISQTILPLRWVIVSDGSTDGTDDIVRGYAEKCDWIELVRMPERRERHFAGKVHAFNAGYEALRKLRYGVIGNLDADITFDADYFAFLLVKFAENPRLGVGGTPFREGNRRYDYRYTSIEHVSGACQLFRRQCFEDIGGYTPIRIGGIDLVAGLTARMKGWQTRTFLEKASVHHRTMGTAKQRGSAIWFKAGQSDYLLGTHPVWEIVHSVYQMKNKPAFTGGCLRLLGFCWATVTRPERCISQELTRFRRREQMHRFTKFLLSITCRFQIGPIFHGRTHKDRQRSSISKGIE